MPTDSSVLALTGLVLLGACGGPQSARSNPSVRAEVGEIPADLMSDYESFAVNCSKCHDLERALAAPVTDTRHWDIYVAKMMRTAGSAIKPSEAPHILRFLYWYTEQKNKTGGLGVHQANSIAPTPAAPTPAAAAAPNKEETQAPMPTPSMSSETEGESTP